jgi:uncharacterized DUF497 family protein
VFSDALAITIPDERFDEKRFVTMGRDGFARVLVFVYTLRGDEIRPLSQEFFTREPLRMPKSAITMAVQLYPDTFAWFQA